MTPVGLHVSPERVEEGGKETFDAADVSLSKGEDASDVEEGGFVADAVEAGWQQVVVEVAFEVQTHRTFFKSSCHHLCVRVVHQHHHTSQPPAAFVARRSHL